MRLYHGTTERAAFCIEKEGFRGSEPTDWTDDFPLREGGVVFAAPTIEEALRYGEVVYVIESDGREQFFQESPLTGDPEYIIPVEVVNQELYYERIIGEANP